MTATDPGNLSVGQAVGVTVTAAPPEPDPPITIDDVKTKYPSLAITPTADSSSKEKEIELPADHTLISENPAVVTVAKKKAATTPASSIRWKGVTAGTPKNVWVVTAVSKGVTDVDVLDKTGASVHTIRVSVTADPPAEPPAPVAPTKTDIPNQKLYKEDGAKTITLADHFSHESAITYAASSSPTGIVTTSVAAGVLTLTPRVKGETIVTVTATADGMSVEDEFTVNVMAGTKTEPEPAPPTNPPAKEGTIGPQTVEAGMSLDPMDVSMYFMPATGLTYMAMSSAPDKATANIPDGSSMLTIRGVAIGPATVTVTATNSAGSAMQTIAVTVTAPGVQHVTIVGKGKTEEVTIGEDQTLDYSVDAEHVTAVPKPGSTTVWVLTGKMKTAEGDPAEVRIKENNRIVGRIMVTVGNTAPKSKSKYPTDQIEPSTGAAAAVHVDKDGKDQAAGAAATPKMRLYHKYGFDFMAYFMDTDGADDIADDGYMAESDDPYFKVVKVQKDGVVVDVIKNFGSTFPLVIYVMDKAGGKSDKITLEAKVTDPLADSYLVTQHSSSGAFGLAEVYQREGDVTDGFHTLKFDSFKPDNPAGTPDHEGFRFVEKFRDDLATEDTRFGSGTIEFRREVSTDSAADTVAPYYLINTSERNIELIRSQAEDTPATSGNNGLYITDDQPEIRFKLTGGRNTTVTITYYVPFNTAATGDANWEWRKSSKSLTMNIVPSSP